MSSSWCVLNNWTLHKSRVFSPRLSLNQSWGLLHTKLQHTKANDEEHEHFHASNLYFYLSVFFIQGHFCLQVYSKTVRWKEKKWLPISFVVTLYDCKVQTLWEGHKIWKNIPPVLTKLLFYSVASKLAGNFFKIPWPFQKSLTLQCLSLSQNEY